MTVKSNSIIEILRRVLMFPLVRIPLLGGVLFLGMGVSNGFRAKYADAPISALVAVLLMVALALAVYWTFVRLVENRAVSEMSLAGMAGQFGAGLGIGFGLYSAAILILALLGCYRIEGLNPVSFMLPMVPMAISSSFMEELIHRGVVFRVTEEYLGSWVALLVNAAIFGAVHLGNPEATVLGALFIAVEAGGLLTAAYMLTRRLWLSIGFHMSWNFAQAAVFSGTVSGVEMSPGLVQSVIAGPDVLTGGQFGVEASVVAFGLCCLVGGRLLIPAIRRAQLVPPLWRRGGMARP